MGLCSNYPFDFLLAFLLISIIFIPNLFCEPLLSNPFYNRFDLLFLLCPKKTGHGFRQSA